jgi:hypothetical protein
MWEREWRNLYKSVFLFSARAASALLIKRYPSASLGDALFCLKLMEKGRITVVNISRVGD